MKTMLAVMTLAVFALSVSPAAAQGGGGETPAAPSAEEKLVYVKMATSMGDIYLELNKEKAPISVENFMKYVEKGHYDGTIFHRVISTFMIQGGGFTPDMKEKPGDKGIKNEWQNGLKNKKGTVAMARRGGDANSATSQFFINVADNDGTARYNLDDPQPDGAAYAVFGKVVAGMDAVEKIKGVKTTTKSGHENVPVEAVNITKVTKSTKEEADKAAGEKK